MDLAYRIVNVFTVDDDPFSHNPFSGNPLAVFENAGALDGDQMQSLARQLNLSETTFVTGTGGGVRSDEVDATVRIFTASYEMPFAGHPTLGTAYVVADLCGRDSVVLGMPAGRVAVALSDGRWTLEAPATPSGRPAGATPDELAAMVGLTVGDLDGDATWIDTGVEQLVLPLVSAAALRRALPDMTLLARHGRSSLGESQIYLWAPTGSESIEARMFFGQGSGVVEDPATGSACANLGGWFHLRGDRGIHRVVRQGDAIHRPSELHLDVDEDGTIRVGGSVFELGRGTMTLP